MSKAEACVHPPVERLRDYALGRLGDGDARMVERHLMSCLACKESLAETAASDRFVEWLQNAHRGRRSSGE